LGVYELNKTELLQDVFVWAYERSCQRYLAITQTMAEPDPLKIRYREALIEAVQSVVRGRHAPSREAIVWLATEFASATDQNAFAQLLNDALQQLHEGSVARYRLKRSDFLTWQAIRNTTPL
jgi:AcrR family transcriptional regulator